MRRAGQKGRSWVYSLLTKAFGRGANSAAEEEMAGDGNGEEPAADEGVVPLESLGDWLPNRREEPERAVLKGTDAVAGAVEAEDEGEQVALPSLVRRGAEEAWNELDGLEPVGDEVTEELMGQAEKRQAKAGDRETQQLECEELAAERQEAFVEAEWSEEAGRNDDDLLVGSRPRQEAMAEENGRSEIVYPQVLGVTAPLADSDPVERLLARWEREARLGPQNMRG